MTGITALSPIGHRPRIAIIGGGVCGLACGWRLAGDGFPVSLFDRAQAGRGASWAAAGMLAAGVECEPGEERLWPLARWGRELWPAFRQELEEVSGIDIGYRDEGTLVVALTRDDFARLRFLYDFQTALGVNLEWLGSRDARRLEPHLASGVSGAVYSAEDHQVDNRKLVKALKRAYLAAGGELHERTEVAGVRIDRGKVTGIATGSGAQAAEIVIVAAGARSRELAGLPEEFRPPVRPVKGQMIALQMDPQHPLLNHVLWTPNGYLVPRRDGRLIAGATVEECGFDDRLTAGGLLAVLEGAWRALPGIENLPVDEMWAGFRPTSRDDAPILGPTEIEGLVMATGHHRNGILLTPGTAEAIRSLLNHGALPPVARPFTLSRFASSEPRAGKELSGTGGNA